MPDSLDNIFKYNGGLRFLDKSVNSNERDNYYSWWDEQIQLYGTKASYHISNFGLDTMDPLYGEQPAQSFSMGYDVVLAVTLNENAAVMQQFGLVADDELTAMITIKSFRTSTGLVTGEPKAGDLIDLTEFGEDRPGERDGKIFEITERIDQDVSQINPLLGHYVWLIKAKRYDYSFEPGIQPEGASQQITESDYYGPVDTSNQPLCADAFGFTDLEKDDIELSSESIFDYSVYGNYDDIYGGYGDD